MIVVRRGTEPDALRRERWWRQARAVLLYEIGRPDLIYAEGYRVDGLHDQLYNAQHRKCAYCDSPPGRRGNGHIEHFRPRTRYPWLSWTFENLLFGCVACNVTYKGEKFPLREGATPLEPTLHGLPEVTTEEALLLDPVELVPNHYIRFRRVSAADSLPERWRPVPTPGLVPPQRDIAEKTIRLFKLDEDDELLEKYDRLTNKLSKKCKKFKTAKSAGKERKAASLWEKLIAYTHPNKQFAALAWSYIDEQFPNFEYPTLDLPHPDDRGDDPTPTDYATRPAWMDEQTWWFVRAAHGKSEAVCWVGAAIIAVCEAMTSPQTDQELGQTLCYIDAQGSPPRSGSTLRRYTKRLCDDGWLTEVLGSKPRQYRAVAGRTALDYLVQTISTNTTQTGETDGHGD